MFISQQDFSSGSPVIYSRRTRETLPRAEYGMQDEFYMRRFAHRRIWIITTISYVERVPRFVGSEIEGIVTQRQVFFVNVSNFIHL